MQRTATRCVDHVFPRLKHFTFDLRSLPVAVADLILVRRMRTAVCFIALFVLSAAMNLLWQLPVVPLPVIGIGTPLFSLAVLLQPWLFLFGPLLTSTPDWVGLALFRVSVHGASIPLTILFSATSAAAYYLIYRAARRVPILLRVCGHIPLAVPVVVYVLLLSIYSASCGYVICTLTQRLKALG
jgi:hypothetical protein